MEGLVRQLMEEAGSQTDTKGVPEGFLDGTSASDKSFEDWNSVRWWHVLRSGVLDDDESKL